MLRNREWCPFALQWSSYRQTPLLEPEVVLKNVWSKVKRQLKKKQVQIQDLSDLLTAFQNIDEPGRLSPKTIFEEFFGSLKKISHSNLGVHLIWQFGEVLLAFSRPYEALLFFQEAIETTIKNKDASYVLNLDNYVKLMSKRRLYHECTLTITQLSYLSQEYNYHRALAFLEAKNYPTAQKILSKCPSSTAVNLLWTRLYFELKNWKKIRRPLHEIMEKEIDETLQWKDKDLKAYLTALYWIGKQAYEQQDYDQALDFFLQLTCWTYHNEDKIYELKEIVLDLMPEVIDILDEILQGEEEERSKYRLDETNENQLYRLLHHYTQGGFDRLIEEKYLKAVMFETLAKLVGVRVFYNQTSVILNILNYFTIFEAYAITENRDLAIKELHEFVKNDGEHYKDDGFMHTIYKEAQLYYANCYYYPEAIECYQTLSNVKEVKEDPKIWAAYSYTQGRILFEDQQHEKSLALFAKCATIKYEPGEAYLWRPAFSYMYLKKYEKAFDCFKKFLKNRTSNRFDGGELTMAFLGGGYCSSKLKQHHEAEKWFKHAVKTKSGDDIPSVPLYRMMAAHDRGNSKDTFKYLKLVMKSIKSVEKLASFLQDKIVDEGRYLKDDWRAVLDTFADHARTVFPNPKTDVHQYKTYRNSSLIVLCLLNKKYDS